MSEQWAVMPGLVQQTVQRDGEPPTVAFYGNASPFSNFHPAKIEFFGHVWPTSEHLFMAWKARFCNDKAVFEQIRHAATPAEAKRLGRKTKKYLDDGKSFVPFPVDEWNAVSCDIMEEIVRFKFYQNEDLKRQLLEVVVDEDGVPAPCKFAEVTAKDIRWGTGCDLAAYLRKEDIGTNHLGQALTEVRNKILMMAPWTRGRYAPASPASPAAEGTSAAGGTAATAAAADDDAYAVHRWSADDWRAAIAAVGMKRQRTRGD